MPFAKHAAKLIALLVVSLPCSGADLHSEEVLFDSRNARLAGSIVFPAHPPFHAAVVFVPGSGKQTRNLALAERLCA